MPAFDLASGIREMVTLNTQVLQRLSDEFPNIANVDPATGTVNIDELRLREILQQVLPPESAVAFTSNLTQLASGGMAILGPTIAMPWVAIEDYAYALQGLPSTLSQDLGVSWARTPEEAIGAIRDRFPSMPRQIFAGGSAELLIQRPLKRPGILMLPSEGANGGGREPREPGEPNPKTKPPARRVTGTIGTVTISGVVPFSPQEAKDAALCLLNGQWSGWWDGWTGWIPGWKVCISQDCADKLANILMGFGGGAALESAIRMALEAGVAAAMKLAASAAASVIAIIGFLLGLNIKLVNGARGVCIMCSWPWSGGLTFWAAPG